MNAYPKHSVRMVHDLDGIWDFTFLGDSVELDQLDLSAISFDDRMPVPSVFDASPSYTAKRGTAAYRIKTPITPGSKSRIRFGGLGMWARIAVDGKALADCSLPYSGFSVDVPVSDSKERELVVIIDNRFDSDRVPLQENFFDFYAYGGIFRTVEWHELPPCSIDRAVIHTVSVEEGKISVELRLNGDLPSAIDLSASIDDGDAQVLADLAILDGTVSFELTVPDPTPWTTADPALHTIHVVTANDDIIERFGLRAVETRGDKILVNGEEQKLLGYCRHEVHPAHGPALPIEQLVQDLDILQDLGCNFVRGSHYPQDQRFLDLCDERGILVKEESLGWGQKAEHFENPAFRDQQEEQTRLMVRNSINHPCVIMWGFLNEGWSHHESSRPLYERLVGAIRKEDQSRLITFASNQPFGDINFDLVDVICVNQYPGWYSGDPANPRPLEEIALRNKQLIAHLEETGFGEKPLIISEIGAGAIPGWHDPHRDRWTEEYQADYLEIACREIIENPRFSGVALWQFCDCRTSCFHALTRPRSFNNKGTVDEYRQPKLAYEVVKQLFRALAAMFHEERDEPQMNTDGRGSAAARPERAKLWVQRQG